MDLFGQGPRLKYKRSSRRKCRCLKPKGWEMVGQGQYVFASWGVRRGGGQYASQNVTPAAFKADLRWQLHDVPLVLAREELCHVQRVRRRIEGFDDCLDTPSIRCLTTLDAPFGCVVPAVCIGESLSESRRGAEQRGGGGGSC